VPRRALALGAALAAFAGSSESVATPAVSAAGTGAGFELGFARARPAIAFFDGRRPIRLRYAFRAERRLDLLVRVVRVGDGKPVRRWIEHDAAPGRVHARRWDGRADGGIPADGEYVFRLGPLAHRGAAAGRFEYHAHSFPVAGHHSYGDRFGEPRSGGRVHEGQDLPSPCGTRLVAARGGRVQARGYSDSLYGHWVLIDGRSTRADHFYAHLERPSPLADGDRVRTGQPVGAVGKTGNARSEFCQLHFELWPRGYRNGPPRDPFAALRGWDAFS
jgi:murein DD-endopeptidase MepM/ murein hydrolase activator NlpD